MKYFLSLYFLLLCLSANAQNLVPNPGFENFLNCPSALGQVHYYLGLSTVTTADHWVSPTLTTPDYFNSCNTGDAGVPLNYRGYYPAHTGNAYAGIIAFDHITLDTTDLLHEYIQVKLTEPLQPGLNYMVSCYVRLFITRNMNSIWRQYALKEIHASFSTLQPTRNDDMIMMGDVTPMTTPDMSFMNDTARWVKISGLYHATGGEEWLTIGILNTRKPVGEFIYTSNINEPERRATSYYAIDDVNVQYVACDTVFNSSDTAICSINPDITIYTTAPSQSYMHLWSTGSQGLSINITQPGMYWCTAISGCNIITDTFHVKGFSDTTVKSTSSDICNMLKLASSFDADEYHWNTGDTTKSISVETGGKYWCTAVKDCRLMADTFIIKGIDTIKTQLHRVRYCVGDTYILSPDSIGSKYIWSTGDKSRNIIRTEQNSYTCYIINGCAVVVEDFETIPVIPPSAYAQPLKDTNACNELPLGWQYEIRPAYRWNTGDTTCCITVSETGVYTITITGEGCPAFTDTVHIKISDCENCLFVPSAYTPNGDGRNDYFKVIPSCPINTFTLRIFNRWGQEVFTTQDVHKGWDGMHGADIADVGTYFYLVEYNTAWSTEMKTTKGDILLMR